MQSLFSGEQKYLADSFRAVLQNADTLIADIQGDQVNYHSFVSQSYLDTFEISKDQLPLLADPKNTPGWPIDIRLPWYEHNAIVYATKKPIYRIELVPNYPFKPLGESNPILKFIVCKIPFIKAQEVERIIMTAHLMGQADEP